MKSELNKELRQKLEKIKLVIMDVDGTLTDGTITYAINSNDLKSFHVHDGMGLKLLKKSGIILAVISSKISVTAEKRFRELDITEKYLGIPNKLIPYNTLKRKYRLEDEQIVSIGDDIPDLPILRKAGVAMAVNNACEEVKAEADYITIRPGGGGAIRECVEMILKAQNKWDSLVNKTIKEWEKDAEE